MHYLGSVSGASGAANNLSPPAGATSFTLGSNRGFYYLEPSASGIQFEFFGCQGPTNTTAQRGAPLNAGLNGPFRAPPFAPTGPDAGFVCGTYNTVAANGSVAIYWTPST